VARAGEEASHSTVTFTVRRTKFEREDLIHSYSRADALADGTLIDAASVATEAGIRFPVALTAAVWARCVAVPPGVRCQD
jgi:hypothetical protein